MKKLSIIVCLAALALSCKPEVYTGPLDSPVGNWKHSWSEFYFNGEQVGSLDTCEYSAISFYDNDLCCIEGMKGAFHYRHSNDSLVIDSATVWKVESLYGDKMTLKHLGEIKPKTYPKYKDITVPQEYRDKTIDEYRNGYYYIGETQDTIQCRPVRHMDTDSTMVLDFWFDSRCDTYKNF